MAEQSTDGVVTTAVSPEGGLTLATASTRAEFVTGGDVLLRLTGEAASVDAEVSIDGEPTDLRLLPAAVWASENAARTFGGGGSGPFVVLLTDLSEGEHLIEVTSGGQTAALGITNHPINGPVFAGPHLEPWICHTEEAGLGPPQDDDCAVDPQTSVESAPTVDGSDVRVRVERGVIDRGIYSIWTPADLEDWNGRLVYRFGGGCGTTYGQGFDLGSGVDANLISRGYAMATNTLDTFQTICNPMVSAEAALMTREHFVETYGVPEFTIGDGGSGGAIQQLLIAQNQPGLLDALSPAAPFPDALSIAGGVSDCGLLVDYYETPVRLPPERGAAGCHQRPPHLRAPAPAGTTCSSAASTRPTAATRRSPPRTSTARTTPTGSAAPFRTATWPCSAPIPGPGSPAGCCRARACSTASRPSRRASSPPRSSSR